MRNLIFVRMTAIALGVMCGCATVREESGSFVVQGDVVELSFVEVNGTSRLPVDYYFGEGDKSILEEVTLPRYWVAERPITHGEYAKVMGLEVPEGTAAEDDVNGLSWMEAFAFTERLNEKYVATLPEGYRFSIPNVIEWLHATRVCELRKTLGDNKEFFIFTGSGTGLMHHTLGDDDFGQIPKCMHLNDIELLPVIVPIVGNAGRFGAPYVARSETLMTNGLIDESSAYFELLLETGGMSKEDLTQIEDYLAQLQEPRDYNYDDWFDMLFAIGEIVSKKGYESEPIVKGWIRAPSLDVENAEVAAEYKRHGISGAFVRVGDLPEGVRADQTICMNRKEVLMCLLDGDNVLSGSWCPSTNTLVQVLRCDFNGDGREDLVVEDFASIGAGGYWYNFYRQEEDGSYSNISQLQTVGLCAVPTKDSSKCAFVTLVKAGNPILIPRLITYKDGEFTSEELCTRNFYLLDADENKIYLAAPFIGGGYGLGWSHLQGRNAWQSPLFWPWEPGTVQGYEEAHTNAMDCLRECERAGTELARLKEKWPHAADRLSCWEMPQHAKRFFEVDEYQKHEWLERSAESTGVFEKMIRECIDLKIEPAIWYYNLSCLLALSERKDEAFDALEQAIVAGYNRVQHARSDADFENIMTDERFEKLMKIMAYNENRPSWQECDESLRCENCEATLSAKNTYFPFTAKAFCSEISLGDNSLILYIDEDGDVRTPKGTIRVRYDEESKAHGFGKGLARHFFTSEGVYFPVIVRGRYDGTEVMTDAFDSKALADRLVLGIYSTKECAEFQDWCILYDGTCEDGVRLAELIAEFVYNGMGVEYLGSEIAEGTLVKTIIKRVHDSMKPGTDGAVIKVKDLDVDRFLGPRRYSEK